MRTTCAWIVLAAAIALAAVTPGRSHRTPSPSDRTADSLFDAASYESLLVFAQRHMKAARASGDSVAAGRMTYQRGRARQILRRPGGLDDFDLALARAEEERDTLGYVNALGVKSFFAMIDGRFDDCLRMNRERIPLAIAIGNRRNEGWGHTLVGYVSLLREDLATAHTEYDAAIAAFRDAKRPSLELTATIGLARVYQRQGNVAASQAEYRRALELADRVGDRGQESDVWNNLAGMEYETGDLALSAAYFRRAYELKRVADAPDLADAAGNIASINVLLGSYAAAESVLVDAIVHAKRWGDTTGLLNLKSDLGRVRAAQGRNQGAIQCYRSALSIYGSIEDRVDAATGLASVLLAQDSVAAAIAVIDSHFVDLARVSPSSWRAEGFLVWARCLRAVGDVPRAEPMARLSWEDAIVRADTSNAILAAVEIGACVRASGDVEVAHEWFLRARQLYAARGPRSSEFRLREAYRVSLADPLLSLSTVLLDAPRTATRETRERSLFDFVQEVKARTLLERVAVPRRTSDIDASFSHPATAARVQDALRDGECLVDFTLAGDEILAFALTNRSVVLTRIARARDASKLSSRYHRLLAQPPAHANDTIDVTAAANSLGALLLGGLSSPLISSSRVFVATDGWLASLPIETLVCPGDGGGAVISKREVVHVPSATLMRLQRARAPARSGAPGSILAVAPSSVELRGAQREVARLAMRYRNVERLRAADRDTFMVAISSRDVVHVASHVRIDNERPWHSGILITASEPAAPDDSSSQGPSTHADAYARAGQIASVHSDARLVVLSGCESALGRATQGEGVLGVAAAFFAAGARSLVASIWEVDDRATADLMERFYDALASGESVSEALRSAQLEVRERRPHPFYWAGFIAIGDPDTVIELVERPWWHRYRIALGMLTAVAVVAWVLVRRRTTIGA